MFKIIYVDGIYRAQIDIKNKPNKYGVCKKFKTREDAQGWIDRHSYKGMSFHYEISEVKE